MTLQVPIAAASVVVLRHDQVLLVRRPLSDMWSPPGGKIEKGETASQAGMRELAEETGVKARVLGLVGEYGVEREGIRYSIACFAAMWEANEPAAISEIAEARFFSICELNKISLTPKAAEAIAAARQIAKH